MMNKKWMILILLLALVGCSSKQPESYNNYRPTVEKVSDDKSSKEEIKADKSLQADGNINEKIIEKSTETKKILTTINYSIQTKTFDTDLNKLNDKIKTLNGSIKSINTNGNVSGRRNAKIIYSVPHDHLDEFLETFKGLSVVSQSMSSEDVSNTYSDNKLRIQSLEAQHKRLLELIAKAQNMDSIVVLESRLSELELEINRLKGTNLGIDEKAKNITVSVALTEIGETQRLETQTSFIDKIGEAFNQMGQSILTGFEEFVLLIIRLLPLIVVGSIGGLIVYKKVKKNKQDATKHPKEEK